MSDSFEHILIPFDNSESARVALRTAVNLCKKFSARMTLVYVNANNDAEQKIKKIIEKIKTRTGIEMFYLRPSGRPYHEIVEAAKTTGADLIIMGTHGAGGVQEFFIGSNAYRVVSSSPVPVLTMRESFDKEGFDRIVVPIDDSTESRQKVPMVKRIAHYFDSEVYVLAASKWDGKEVKRKVTRYGEQVKEMLEEEGITTHLHTSFGGNISNETMDYADSIGADLIIAMSETEPSAGFFMGANAQRLVNHSETPILTVHATEVVIGVAGY
jgi:nucleotide-binding universal stress UspA family protein